MKNEKVYFMGIAGTGMASAAGLLKTAGFNICGSDHQVYPPMSDMLKSLKINYSTPYSQENLIREKPDLVVVANCLSRGHEELEFMMSQNIPYTSFPKLIGERFLSKSHSIVVSGTHGKTTTSSLMAYFLKELDEDPSFLIGGIPRNFTHSFRLGRSPLFVIEGDEYDTAFFDKNSKFLHYAPKTLILNNLEFDHADIFASIEDIENEFTKLINLVPYKKGIIANIDDPGVFKLLKKLDILDKVTSVSTKGLKKSQYFLENLSYQANLNTWQVQMNCHNKGSVTIDSPLAGYHNAANLMMVVACLLHLEEDGHLTRPIDMNHLGLKLSHFKGISRRFDHLCTYEDIEVFEDFAHHPTAVKHVIESFRLSHPKRRLIVAFEPKNATSRRNIFLQQYIDILSTADVALIGACHNDTRIPKNQRMDTRLISESIGSHSKSFDKNEELCEWLLDHTQQGDSVIFMSSGSFSGVAKKFCTNLSHQS